jgi:hypothetical protein
MAHTILRIRRKQHDSLAPNKGAGLIMSATLVPPTLAVARSDPADRLRDYLDALRYYLSLPNSVIDRIVFVDNSNGDIAPLAELAQSQPHEKDVDLISFAGNDHAYQLGKAYGEFKLMDYGLANTSLFGADDIVWKTTGRLKFLNLEAMTRRCRTLSFDVLCDLHNVPWVGSGDWRDHQNMDLRVFAFRMRAYDAILRDLWRHRELGFDARFMYQRMRQAHPGFRVVPRFPLQPQLQGISGRHQRDYRSTSQRAKDALRGAARRITPWLWL